MSRPATSTRPKRCCRWRPPPAPGREPDPAIAAAAAALRVAEQAAAIGDLAPLEKAVAENPDNHQARFDLALALNAKGRRDEAADALLTIFKRDRKWNDEAARKQLLQFFEAWGLMDSGGGDGAPQAVGDPVLTG